jgi:tRNA dimethylallyltransferase
MDLLVILGPTASGKTRLAVDVASHMGGEIISADSRQVYMGLDLGTGKDLEEYGNIPYHLIDIIRPGEEFSLFDFLNSYNRAYQIIADHGHLPLLVGGTGLYLDAVLRHYELFKVGRDEKLRKLLEAMSETQLKERLLILRPQMHNTTDITDRERLIRAIEIEEGQRAKKAQAVKALSKAPRVFGLTWPREELRKRITQRLITRLDSGMIEEVESLSQAGVSWKTFDFLGLEYRYVALYLQGKINRNDLFQKLNSAIHQFAKRQQTWFRRMEKNGVQIHWLQASREPLKEVLMACEDSLR